MAGDEEEFATSTVEVQGDEAFALAFALANVDAVPLGEARRYGLLARLVRVLDENGVDDRPTLRLAGGGTEEAFAFVEGVENFRQEVDELLARGLVDAEEVDEYEGAVDE